jgi:hypothetical protein
MVNQWILKTHTPDGPPMSSLKPKLKTAELSLTAISGRISDVKEQVTLFATGQTA